MLYKDEIKILTALKSAPIFMIAFSVIIIIAMVKSNNLQFEEEIRNIKQESITEKKQLIKREVQRVHNFISNEKQQTVKNIKNNIKNRVYEAHVIASAIYQNNKHKPDHEIKKLITDTLRNIRS